VGVDFGRLTNSSQWILQDVLGLPIQRIRVCIQDPQVPSVAMAALSMLEKLAQRFLDNDGSAAVLGGELVELRDEVFRKSDRCLDFCTAFHTTNLLTFPEAPLVAGCERC